MNKSLYLGIAAAVLAAASWSLSFIAPFVIGRYSLYDFAVTEFLLSAVIGAGLLLKDRARTRTLRAGDFITACWLGLIGYFGYFLTVMGAAVYAGPVIAPAFIGLVPVVLAVAGNHRRKTVSWSALWLPLGVATVGLLLVNGTGLLTAGDADARSPAIGIPLSLLAVGLWTVFGLHNETALSQRPHMDAGIWSALLMVGAGCGALLFIPVGLAAGVFEIPRLGLQWHVAFPLLLWAAALALFANVGGAFAWTFATQRLPVVLAAQLITMEPTFGTAFGLLIHRRWPTALEAVGMGALLTGVVLAIRLFAAAAAALPQGP